MARLCAVTFIVEAGLDSGTKHQVKAAIRFGHKVGFLRPLWEMGYPWIKEAAEKGCGFCIESRKDVLAILRLAGIAPVAQENSVLHREENNAAEIAQPELAFEIATREDVKPKSKRARKKKKPKVELEAEQPPLPGTA